MALPAYSYIGNTVLKNIKEQYIVPSFDPASELVIDTIVKDVINKGVKMTWLIKTETKGVFVTEDQPLLFIEEDPIYEILNYVWRCLADMEIGDELVCIDKEDNLIRETIQQINKNREEEVWELRINKVNNFITNGCVASTQTEGII